MRGIVGARRAPLFPFSEPMGGGIGVCVCVCVCSWNAGPRRVLYPSPGSKGGTRLGSEPLLVALAIVEEEEEEGGGGGSGRGGGRTRGR